MDDKSITLWLWRVTKPNARWRGKLRWRMTEERAREWAAAEGVELERIEGSVEVRQPVGLPTTQEGWKKLIPDKPGEPGRDD